MVTYQDKPWLQHYDSGVPASLAPYPQHPLHQFLSEAAQEAWRFGGDPVIGSFARRGARQKHAELPRVEYPVRRIGGGPGRYGIEKGDRVAIILPNCAQFVISFYAILKAGGVVVASTPRIRPRSWPNSSSDSGAVAAITLSLFYNNVKQIQQQTAVRHVIVTNIKEYLPGAAKLFVHPGERERRKGHRIEKATGRSLVSGCAGALCGQKTERGCQRRRSGDFPVYGRDNRHPQGGHVHPCGAGGQYPAVPGVAGAARMSRKVFWRRSRCFTSLAWSP